jgi:hypothetical protein
MTALCCGLFRQRAGSALLAVRRLNQSFPMMVGTLDRHPTIRDERIVLDFPLSSQRRKTLFLRNRGERLLCRRSRVAQGNGHH